MTTLHLNVDTHHTLLSHIHKQVHIAKAQREMASGRSGDVGGNCGGGDIDGNGPEMPELRELREQLAV